MDYYHFTIRKLHHKILEILLFKGEAPKLFKILYKRYSRKRHTYKKAVNLGKPREIEKARSDYEEYDFFHWFNEHLREYRAFHTQNGDNNEGFSDDEMMTGTVTMVKPSKYYPSPSSPATVVSLQGGFHHSQLVVDDHQNYQQQQQQQQQQHERVVSAYNSNQQTSNSQQTTNFHPTPISVCLEPQQQLRQSPQSPLALKIEQHPSPQQQQQVSSSTRRISENILDGMNDENSMQPSTTSTTNHSSISDDIFGQMIAAELKTFPQHIKFRVKHELSNVIFNFREQQLKPS